MNNKEDWWLWEACNEQNKKDNPSTLIAKYMHALHVFMFLSVCYIYICVCV